MLASIVDTKTWAVPSLRLDNLNRNEVYDYIPYSVIPGRWPGHPR